MQDSEVTTLLNARDNPALETLGGRMISFDSANERVAMTFLATPQMCHSEVIVQGGFITGMLDSAMAYAAMAVHEGAGLFPTLEIKVNFLAVGNAGTMSATGRVVRMGRTVGFLEAELSQNDRLIATATSTVRVIVK